MKPGFRTTEFWVTAATLVGAIATAIAGVVPGKVSLICGAISSAAYALSRGLSKVPPPPTE